MQRASAFRTDTFSLRQLVDHLLHRQTGEVHLPLPSLLAPFIGDLLQSKLRRFRIRQRLRFIEQAELLRKHLGLLTGRAKFLPPRQAKLLGQPFHLPVQRGDLIFFFIKQRLPFGVAFYLCIHAHIISEKCCDFNYHSTFLP